MKPLEIKGARTRLGYSQRYMSERLGIHYENYRKKERGVVKFTEDEKFAMGEILELSLEQLNDFLFDGKIPLGMRKDSSGMK